MIEHVVFWARAGFKGALLKIGFGTGEWAPHAAPSPAKATAAVLLCTLITLGSIAAGIDLFFRCQPGMGEGGAVIESLHTWFFVGQLRAFILLLTFTYFFQGYAQFLELLVKCGSSFGMTPMVCTEFSPSLVQVGLSCGTLFCIRSTFFGTC